MTIADKRNRVFPLIMLTIKDADDSKPALCFNGAWLMMSKFVSRHYPFAFFGVLLLVPTLMILGFR